MSTAGTFVSPTFWSSRTMVRQGSLHAELVGWCWLAVASLATAGGFAIMLAVSRVPGVEHFVTWPANFFAKGLVIHVVFSLAVWLQTLLAVMATFATARIAGDGIRLAPLGFPGMVFVGLAFPLLFIPAFFDSTVAMLSNYIPVILHPLYDLGLLSLGIGILLPVLRLLANLPGRVKTISLLPYTVGGASAIYIVSFCCFCIGYYLVARAGFLDTHREYVFWGGGHLLQFVYCSLMLVGWLLLAHRSFGPNVIDRDIAKLVFAMLFLFCLPGPIFYRAFQEFSEKQQGAFRILQFVLALPTLMISISLLANALGLSRPAKWPWKLPAFSALWVSMAVFGVGGLMGIAINGADTRTPAHYHATMAGVTLAGMALFLNWCLPHIGREKISDRLQRAMIYCYGFGQLAASIGLFLAGGYGAPRKTPSGAGILMDGAAVGMALHGIGALVAVIGGALFVYLAIRALLGAEAPDAASRPLAQDV